MSVVAMNSVESASDAFGIIHQPFYLQLTSDDLGSLDDTYILASQFNAVAYFGYAPKVLSVERLRQPYSTRYRFSVDSTDLTFDENSVVNGANTYTVTGWYLHDSAGNVLAAEAIDNTDVTVQGDYVEVQPDLYASLVSLSDLSGYSLTADEDLIIFPDWVTSTPYVTGNLVNVATVRYACIGDHTSGTFATDLAHPYWVAVV